MILGLFRIVGYTILLSRVYGDDVDDCNVLFALSPPQVGLDDLYCGWIVVESELLGLPLNYVMSSSGVKDSGCSGPSKG